MELSKETMEETNKDTRDEKVVKPWTPMWPSDSCGLSV